ncbi:hypothetical protein CKM354_000516300 [Cercospora kikuchii]|uniref:Calcineurin-like phosphoesterase domain-containing protein n=1 Tax=Cercospora kikuchii TaxID=84275 RepID=A0A9P3CCT2_9PEZI|nr:uncharacterized protein CKM354_000516300 [Cercospora kikuchii]GIZ41874.1 hypothetical protein CKM354_000516300 [Cercospora kikuchii]
MSALFLRVHRLLLLPTLIATLYLYFYPIVHQCSFPSNTSTGQPAPFRLLAFGDPQLEGDTSLPGHGHTELFPSVRRIIDSIQKHGIGQATTSLSSESRRLWHEDLPRAFRTYHKKLDLWGNDRYLAHIYRTIKRDTDPTHVVVLGDLLGSQWIDDDEFERRAERFWNTVFAGAAKVPDHVAEFKDTPAEALGKDKSWRNRIITVAGNHDIGYAGDIDFERIERFEKAFGRVNYEIPFFLNDTSTVDTTTGKPSTPNLRLMILNSMNLDEPTSNYDLHLDSNNHLNQRLYWEIPQDPTTATVLLTHIPLYKPAGICTDGPFFDYFPQEHGSFFSGGIKEQNHLSEAVSTRLLEGIVGPERTRKSIILNGHDHAGCDTYHSRTIIEDIPPPPEPRPNLEYEDEESENDDGEAGSRPERKPREARDEPPRPPPYVPEKWMIQKYPDARKSRMKDANLTGVREVTVRSMMGEFGGNAGLLSAWWDQGKQEWKFEYASCQAGVQHIWWAVHVADLITLGLGAFGALLVVVGGGAGTQGKAAAGKKKKNKKKGKKKEQ